MKRLLSCFYLGLLGLGLLSAQETTAYDCRLDSLRLPAPVFSHEHGFYDESFYLTIQAAKGYEQCPIVYTIDGSDPGANHGKGYAGPILISKTSVVRACLLSKQADRENSRITTRTYLFVDDIIHQQRPEGYPERWGPYAQRSGYATADYDMDPELCDDPDYAQKVREGLLSLPVVSIVTDKDNLFSDVDDAQTGGIYIYTDPPTGYTKTQVADPGTKWIRASSAEMFDAQGSISWQADCGLRLHGGHSRLAEKTPKHSFRLVFKEQYGSKKLKKVNIFGPTQAKKLDNIVLRAGFCNTWLHANTEERNKAAYTRDAWAKEVQRQMGHPASHQMFAHLFLNGIYWGLYNPTERIDAKWCEEYLKGLEEEYDVIKVEDNPQTVLAGDGSIDAWQQLFNLSAQAADETVYQRIQGLNPDGTPNGDALLDVVNFIDYMIINIYGGNTDWDRHNWLAVRNRVNPGSGFKMLCWDSEHVLKSLNQDVGIGEKRSLCPSTLFGNLMKNPGFVRLVGDRIQRNCYQGGALTPESAAATWTALSQEIYQALDCEAARWGDYRRDVHQWSSSPYELYTKATHYDPLQKKMLEEILPGRRDVFVGQMRKLGLFPSIDAPVIRLNGDILTTDTFALGDRLSLSSDKGTIYYMTDGTDPVQWDSEGQGSLRMKARLWQGDMTLEDSCLNLTARALYDETWSALSQACIRVPAPPAPVSGISRSLVYEDFHFEWAVDDASLQLSCDLPRSGQLELAIYDLGGRTVLRHHARLSAGRGCKTRVETGQLSRGAYLVKYRFLSESGREQLASGSLKFIRP